MFLFFLKYFCKSVNMKIQLLILIGFILLFKVDVSSQTVVEFYNKGEIISQTGIMYVNGNITNETNGASSGKILLDGTLKLTGNFTNNATASLADASTVSSYGKVLFAGNTNTQIINGTSETEFENVEVNNTAIASPGVSLGKNTKISNDLTFTAGHFFLGNYNLTLDDASITNYTNAKFVVTNATGNLKRNVATPSVVFPVGYNAAVANYNPLSISNSTVTTKFDVRSQDNQLTNGATGNAMMTKNITNSWYIKPLDTTTSASITMNWNSGDEPPTFDNTNNAVIRYNPYSTPTEWNAVSVFAPSTLSKTATIATNWGWFGVGDKDDFGIRVFVKVFLQGPFNSGTGKMSNSLYTNAANNKIPLMTPYCDDYTPAGPFHIPTVYNKSYHAPTVSVASIPLVGGTLPTDGPVDWILVVLRKVNTVTNGTTVMYKRSGFLSKSGDIYNTDGTKGIAMSGVSPGYYYVSILHRNHLPVIANDTIFYPNTDDTKYDFTSDISKSYSKPAYIANNKPQKSINGYWALWAGEVTKSANYWGSVAIRPRGGANDPLPIYKQCDQGGPVLAVGPGYYDEDVNMDRYIRPRGGLNEPLIIFNNCDNNVPPLLQIYAHY